MSHWKFIESCEEDYYFLTATIIDWSCIFISRKYFEIVIESLKYCQEKKSLQIAGYVIMPNHIHLLCSGSAVHPLSDTMRDFKQFTARKIIKELHEDGRDSMLSVFRDAATLDDRGNSYKVWIEGVHPILVNQGFMFQQKLKYIHENPVRKGFIEEPEHWVYSSARNYVYGDHSVIKVECLE